MKISILLLTSLLISSTSVNAFLNTDNFSPFGNMGNMGNMGNLGGFDGSNSPWSNNSNWNPMSSGSQYAPANDVRNMSRFGAQPRSLRSYRQDPRFTPENNMMQMPNQVQPSNWLKDTDFSKTLEQIKNTGSKNFFVNEVPFSFDKGYQHVQDQSLEIEKALKDQMQRYDNKDAIYGRQGYSLSPAASSTPRVDTD
jgi:hypothetical protein